MPRRNSKTRNSIQQPATVTAAKQERDAKVQKAMLALGYVIVALAVVGGFVLSFYPRAFGLESSNPAVGFGLATLAVFRLYFLRREVRRQTAESV